MQSQVLLDEIDWTTQSGTSGFSINGLPWSASGTDQDGNGVFGVVGDKFVISDTEGSQPCPCGPSDPGSCGNNDNTVELGTFPITNYCEATVSFEITTTGNLNCGDLNDQDVNSVTVGACPSDLGNEWAGTDALEIVIISLVNGEERRIKICGDQSSTGSLSISETFDIGAIGTALSITITGGTQNGGAYEIGAVQIEGVPRINTAINLEIAGRPAGNNICVGDGSFELNTGIADAGSQYIWAFPDGNTVSGTLGTGDDILIVDNITPANSGIYRVTVVDANLCELSDEITVTVLPSSDQLCQSSASFNDINLIECSSRVLPSEDDNGIQGSWSPGANLIDFVGQTLNFTFTPDDPSVASETLLITVEDESLLESFGTRPVITPTFCNAADSTYDFIELFQLEFETYRLEVQGDIFLFQFIPLGATADIESFESQFRAISVREIDPQENLTFSITGYTNCGSEPLTKEFSINIVGPADPIRIDTTLCRGDILNIHGHEFTESGFVLGDNACDTVITVNITETRSTTTSRVFARSAACGEGFYYYEDRGFVKGSLADPPPFGPDYDTLFTTTFQGNYTLPIPNSAGCDSIQRMSISIGRSTVTRIAFDLCANQDTIIQVGASDIIVDRFDPYYYIPTGAPCTFIEIDATILPAVIDSIPQDTFCAGEIITVEVAPGIVRDFDASMTFPQSIPVSQGSNGCPATVEVNYFFRQPTRGSQFVRLCPGETFSLGTETFSQAVTDRDVLLSGAAATGCDSIVSLTIEIIEPEIIPVNETICQEDNFTLEGEIFDFSRATGQATIPSSKGCDSIIYDVTLDFHSAPDIVIDTALCPGEEIVLSEYNFTINDQNLTADLLTTTAEGCTQNVLIRARIDDPVTFDLSAEICDGDTYSFGGVERTQSGSYQDILIASSGCDSIVTLNLNVLAPIPDTDDGIITECTGLSVSYLGQEYDTPGNYSVTLQSAKGCDSTVVFEVAFDAIPRTDIGILNTCPGETLTYLGKDYSAEGTYEDTIQTNRGCDSILMFELVYFTIPQTDLGDVFTCPNVPYNFEGTDYPDEGTYTETFISSDGCDSLVSFTVVFEPIPMTDIGDQFTCPGETFTFLGKDYTTEGTYEDTILTSEGCDSIISFNLVYHNIPETDLGDVFTCPNVPFNFNGTDYPDEGTYTETLVSSDGCDSLVNFNVVYEAIPMTDIGIQFTCPGETLDLFGNEYTDEGNYEATLLTAEGCDSIVTFELRYFEIRTEDIGVLSSCAGQPVDFLGAVYTVPGDYSETIPSSLGCDSIINFSVAFIPVEPVDVIETICPGEQVFVFNNAFAVDTDTLLTLPGGASTGCDTTVHLQLTIVDHPMVELEYDICPGEVVQVGNQTFSTTTINEEVTFTSSQNCDSTVIVTVRVKRTDDIDLGTITICESESFEFNNQSYTDEGVTTVVLTNSEGCDSTVTFEIVRAPEYVENMPFTLCYGESVEVNGVTYDASGVYTDTLSTSDGCDSVLVIDLEFLPQIDTTYLPAQTLCVGGSVDVGGTLVSDEGDNFVNLTADNGCDSVVVVNIIHQNEPALTIQEEICEGQSYSHDGQQFNTTGTHFVTYSRPNDCDSVVVIDLIVHPVYTIDLGTVELCQGASIVVGGLLLESPDDYSIPLTSSEGCDSTVLVTIVFVDAIREDLGTVQLCDGDSYSFGGQIITQNGTFSDTTSTADGCDSITTVRVEFTPALTINIEDLIGSCEGGANGSFVIESIPGASPPFSVFGLPNVTTIQSLPYTVSGLSEGEYNFDIEDANGCLTMGNATITNDRSNALSITVVEIDPQGIFELILEYDGDIVSIEWEDVEGLSCYDCPNPSVDIEETTTFSVTVVDAEGCINMGEVTLTVDGIGNVFFPNVINPNSTLGNHRFFPQVSDEGFDAQYDLYIFDRWGNMVYHMINAPVNDDSYGWNGRYADNRINAGVFVYSVRLFKPNGLTESFKGDLTVVE